jgi:hypothetical protein
MSENTSNDVVMIERGKSPLQKFKKRLIIVFLGWIMIKVIRLGYVSEWTYGISTVTEETRRKEAEFAHEYNDAIEKARSEATKDYFRNHPEVKKRLSEHELLLYIFVPPGLSYYESEATRHLVPDDWGNSKYDEIGHFDDIREGCLSLEEERVKARREAMVDVLTSLF